MISRGTVVTLAYHLKGSTGEELDRADRQDPFTYLHGVGEIVPGLERALEGLNVGDKKNVTVSADDGYGEVDPSLKMKIERKQFPANAELEKGMQFAADIGDGNEMVFTIENVEENYVHVDGNHPLAGETLHFEVEVLAVRPATQEELSHGHVHGPHGHTH